MEIKNIINSLISTSKGSKKGQLFTLTTLILFILMLSVLFSFVFIEIQYSTQQQNVAISSGQVNIISSINTTAREFGLASAQQALLVLSYYEYNSSLRHDNFVSNFTNYMYSLMSTAMLPNVQSGTPANYLINGMGNLTFSQYNSSLVNYYSSLGIQSVNETKFKISQVSTYKLSISYLENIIFNQTGTPSVYSIPVNVTFNLTGKPDLFYSQQGIIRDIKFSNIHNQTQLITGSYANTGSNYGESYGTVVFVNTNSCPSYTASEESSMILVANQLSGLSSCDSNFQGIITNQTGFTSSIPYIVYSQNTVLENYFLNGTNVELYPKQLEALNIQNLIKSVSNGYYFGSPYTSSYVERAADLQNQSNYGIFTFSNNERTVANFNGLSSIVLTPSSNLEVPVVYNGISINIWMQPKTFEPINTGILTTGPSGCGFNLVFVASNSIQASDNCLDSAAFNYQFTPGVWYDIGLTITSGSILSFYVNGNLINTNTNILWADGTSWANMYLGSNLGSDFFNGSMSNVQIYNSTLSSSSMNLLYKRNLNGLPISNNGLVGWFDLNGNTNDLSGQNTVVSSSNVNFTNRINGVPSTNVSYFNGVDSYVSLPQQLFNFPTSGSTSSYTASFGVWFKTTSDGLLLGQENEPIGTTPGGWVPAIYIGTNGVVLASMFWHGSTTDQIISPTTYNDGEWHYLVDTYSNGVETLYIDGKKIGTDSNSESSYSSTYYYYLGSGYSGGWPDSSGSWFYFNGDLANAQIYNTQLSQQQVDELYTAGLSSAPITFSGLVGWYPLNGNLHNLVDTQPFGYPNNVVYSSINGSVITPQNQNLNSVKIPGVFCTNSFSCHDSSSSGVYLGSSPLESGSQFQVAHFNYNSIITSNVPLSGNFGLSMWILPGKSSAEEYPLSFSGVNGITVTSSGTKFTLTDGTNTLSSSTITPMDWYFVAVSKNGNSYTLYLNNSAGSTSSMANIAITNLTLGSLLDLSDGFNGSISNVQLYSNPLSSSEVQNLYNEGIYGSTLTSNVVAWYPLNGNCYNYTYDNHNCYLSRNITYSYMYGNYSAPNYPIQTVENGYQALGYGTVPS